MARGQTTTLTQQIQRKKSANEARKIHQENNNLPSSTGLLATDTRTPLAWQHRNLNYQHLQDQQASYIERINSPVENVNKGHPYPQHQQNGKKSSRRQSSISSSETSSQSSSTTTQNRIALNYYPTSNGISTWDGEPCPVHHLPSAISAILSPPPPPNIILPQSTLNRPAVNYADKWLYTLLPPMMRPRPLVLPAADSTNLYLEPLPVRDPKISNNNIYSTKDTEKMMISSDGCHGHTIVLWFIISVITIGVVLAAVLRFVMG